MNKEETIKILSANLAEIQKRFGVESLALFGSVSKGTESSASDLDLLVTFTQVPGIFSFLDLKDYLENLVQRPVDLVTMNALKRQLKDQILKDIVRVH